MEVTVEARMSDCASHSAPLVRGSLRFGVKALCMTGGEFDLVSFKLADAMSGSNDNLLRYDGTSTDDVITVCCVEHSRLPWPIAKARNFATDDSGIYSFKTVIILFKVREIYSTVSQYK